MTPREANQRIKNAFWTVAETAKVIGYDERTIRVWTSTGRIESIRLGPRRLIPAHAVLAYFAPALDSPWTRYETIRELNEFAAMFGKEPFDFGILDKTDTPIFESTQQDDPETADLKTAIGGLVVEHSGNRIP